MVSRLTEYRTPLAPIAVSKPMGSQKKKGLPLLLIAIVVLLVAGIGGAALGLYLKKSAEKQATLIEKIQETARAEAMAQIRAAEEAEAKRNAEADAKRAEELRLKKEAEKRKAEEAAIRVETEKKAEAARLKVDAERVEAAKQKAEEENRSRDAVRVKAAAAKAADLARQNAEAEKQKVAEREQAEAERQRLATEEQKALEEAARLVAAVNGGREDANMTERERAVLQLVCLARQEADAKTYYTFIVNNAPRNMETRPLVAAYEEAREDLIRWADSQTLTASKLRQLTESQLASIRKYAMALALFLNTHAVEVYAKKTRMKEANRKTWEQLVKESSGLKTMAMDTDASRLRLVNVVRTISSEAK